MPFDDEFKDTYSNRGCGLKQEAPPITQPEEFILLVSSRNSSSRESNPIVMLGMGKSAAIFWILTLFTSPAVSLAQQGPADQIQMRIVQLERQQVTRNSTDGAAITVVNKKAELCVQQQVPLPGHPVQPGYGTMNIVCVLPARVLTTSGAPVRAYYIDYGGNQGYGGVYLSYLDQLILLKGLNMVVASEPDGGIRVSGLDGAQVKTFSLVGNKLSSNSEIGAGTPDSYTFTRNGNSIVYGQPRQVAAIRIALHTICSDAIASEMIQVEHYAIAEGSCGNPELHAVLLDENGTWKRAPGTRCGFGGGVVPDYGEFGLYNTLVTNCGFPVATVKQIIAIRAKDPWVAREDALEEKRERDCRQNPQSSTLCSGHKFTPDEQRLVDYNHYFAETSSAAQQGDFSKALGYARLALQVEPSGTHVQENRIALLSHLISEIDSGLITRTQAIAEWIHSPEGP